MIRTKTVPMPCSIRAFTRSDVNGDYDIIINADLSDEAKLRAYKHEMLHILNNDFENRQTVSIDSIEMIRHGE